MTNKKLWLGMLALVLVFGMTVVGCDEESTDSDPKFKETITVLSIPGDRNGESFTMSLIKNGNTFASKGGTITGNAATAQFVLDSIPDSVVLINNEYQCYLSLKIGNDAAKISTKQLGFPISTEGTYLGSLSETYANLFQ